MTRSARGFTLVELCIVVAIIGVLAVVAGTAYRRYMDSARTSEAYAVLGEIRIKEEAFRAENSTYTGLAPQSEAITDSFPLVDGGSCYPTGSKEPCQKAAVKPPPYNATPPAWWDALGINTGRNTLQCGYLINAGAANAAVNGTLGKQILNAASAPSTPWWYAVAICDNDGDTATNATFTTGFSTTVVSAQNEHK
jgi:prepilin-type N-terminal cleavage/methylation domain-containing protein